MPEGFAFPQKHDLWVPLVRTPQVESRDWRALWFAFGRLEQRLEALPGVASVTFASELPTWSSSPVPYEIGDQASVDGERRPETAALVVGSDYFRTLEAPLLARICR
ncbi:MAG TPA: hypothetical protein VFV10_01680 [Gammaproteobacteria bacterium]|nr:hypothetical protein [Gammaproteobacteria bacterium]